MRLASTEGYDRIISSAVLRVEDDHIYWSPEVDMLEFQPGYVMETGHIVLADTAESLKTNEQVRKTYLGES